MPIYMYKAVTKGGVVVKNKVESSSKEKLIQLIKDNDLVPIDIEQLSERVQRKTKKRKRNVTDIQEIMQNVNTTQLGNKKKTLTTKEKINLYFAKSEKITHRDVTVFTQNFYLLK